MNSLARLISSVFLAVMAVGASRAGVTLTATQDPPGPLAPGSTFFLDLTWSGDTAVGATDYTIALGTGQLLFNSRQFDGALSLADTEPTPGPTVATNSIFTTWFSSTGFLGRDVRLGFTVPANYSGPATVPVSLVVDSVQDTGAQTIAHTTVGLSLTINLPTTTVTYQAGDGKLSASDYADAQINQAAASAGTVVGGGIATTISIKEDTTGTDDRIGLFGFFNLFGTGANQIPAGATLVSATLQLRCTDGGKIQDIYIVDRAWTETTVTWNNFFSNNPTPGPAQFGTPLTTVGPVVAGTTYTLDIKTALQQWSANPASNYGLLLDSNGSGGGSANDPLLYVSGEYTLDTTLRPKLTVTYSTTPAPSAYSTWINSYAGLSAVQREPTADPDLDGANNLVEFATMGTPTNAASTGLGYAWYEAAVPESNSTLNLVSAVRRGATFALVPFNGQVASIDGITYLAGGATVIGVFTNNVLHSGPTDTAPSGSGLPSLTGGAWEYHHFRFSGSPSQPARGYLRLGVTQD
jgi:hypothetical protein